MASKNTYGEVGEAHGTYGVCARCESVQRNEGISPFILTIIISHQ